MEAASLARNRRDVPIVIAVPSASSIKVSSPYLCGTPGGICEALDDMHETFACLSVSCRAASRRAVPRRDVVFLDESWLDANQAIPR